MTRCTLGKPLLITTLGIAPADLPSPFHDFLAFINTLNEAQKLGKDKILPKVRLILAKR